MCTSGALALVLILIGGCASISPWERGNLARPEMAWDPDPSLSAFRRLVFYSKEAATGGASTTGGGCGCN